MTKETVNHSSRGGRRAGAGRKPAIYGETLMLRVPRGCLPEILKIIGEFKTAPQKTD